MPRPTLTLCPGINSGVSEPARLEALAPLFFELGARASLNLSAVPPEDGR